MAARRKSPDTARKEPLVRVNELSMTFHVGGARWTQLLGSRKPGALRAVSGVSFEIPHAKTFAIVGESGCGKSTVARCLVGLYRPSHGCIEFDGTTLSGRTSAAALMPFRRRVQMVFQDPYSSLNPRWRAERIISEPIRTHEPELSAPSRRARVEELLEQVGLSAGDGRKYPHQFSGGQRQRISIARALASKPDFIICDEPTSALDVSVQAQILNLMTNLQRELGLTYLFISHDLAVVNHVADEVAVMYLGRLVEWGKAKTILSRPLHPYTTMLFETVPDIEQPNRSRIAPGGEVPNPMAPPSGCAFHPRCPAAREICKTTQPPSIAKHGRHLTCHAVEQGWIGSQ